MDYDKKILIPRYYLIYEELYKEIIDGQYQVGDKFPSDTELCERYKVSRGTVREAVKKLFHEGLLVREQGRGTFVTHKPEKIEQDAQQLMGFSELMKMHSIVPTAKVLEQKTITPDKKIKEILKLVDKDKTVKIHRLRYGNNEPLIVERSYFVYDLFQQILKYDLEKESIYEVMYRETSLRLGSAHQTIEAIAASPVDSILLKIESGLPLLLIKRIIMTKEGKYFQYSEDIYRSDKLNFITQTADYESLQNNLQLSTIKQDTKK